MLATVFGLLAGALLICQAALAAGDAQCDGQATGRKFGPQGQVLAWVNGSFHCTASSSSDPNFDSTVSSPICTTGFSVPGALAATR